MERVAEEDALLERRPIAEKRTRAEMELSQKVLLKWFKESRRFHFMSPHKSRYKFFKYTFVELRFSCESDGDCNADANPWNLLHSTRG